MKFGWVTINVKEMKRSLEFYTDVTGLGVNRQIEPMPGTEIVFLGDGESNTQVELICNQKNREPNYGKDISLGFETSSLDKTVKMLDAKKIPYRGPFQP